MLEKTLDKWILINNHSIIIYGNEIAIINNANVIMDQKVYINLKQSINNY